MPELDRRALTAGAVVTAGVLALLAHRVAEAQTVTTTPQTGTGDEGEGREIHVVGITAKGRLYHTIRRADGEWDRWGEPNGPDDIRGVAVA
jgi:hypothetical protein